MRPLKLILRAFGSPSDPPAPATEPAALQQRRLAAADATRQLAAARHAARAAEAARVHAEAELSSELAREPQREEARLLVDRLAATEAQVLRRDQARARVRTAAEVLGRRTEERDAAAASLEKVRRQIESAERDVEQLTAGHSRLPLLQSAARAASRALKDRERLESDREAGEPLDGSASPASPELALARERAAEAESALSAAEAAGLELETRKACLSRSRQQEALSVERLSAAEKAVTDAAADLETARAAVAELSNGVPTNVHDLTTLDHELSAARRRVKGMEQALAQAQESARAASAGVTSAAAALASAEHAAAEAGRLVEQAAPSAGHR